MATGPGDLRPRGLREDFLDSGHLRKGIAFMAKQRSPNASGEPMGCLSWDPHRGRCCFAPTSVDPETDVRRFARDILGGLREKHGLKMASLRSVHPVHRLLIHLASEGAGIEELRKPVLYCSDAQNLSGISVESRSVVIIDDIKRPRNGRKYAHPWLVSELGLKKMISIPVLNTCNMNQVLLVLNLYPSADSPTFDRRELARLGESLAVRFEGLLRDSCIRCATRLSIAIAKLKRRDPTRIYDTLARILKKSVGEASIGIYVERLDHEGVELQSARGDDFTAGPGTEIDQLALKCWKSNRELLAVSPRKGERVYFRELLPSVAADVVQKTPSSAFVPLRDLTGRAKGVVCCLKGRQQFPVEGALYPFTYEDIAVIEAIGQAFVPQLEILMADYRRTQFLSKLAHELRVPLVAFGAAMQRIAKECQDFRYTFRHEYLDDLELYRDVMRRLLKTVDLARIGPEHVPLAPRKTLFHKDIVAPAVRFIHPLLRQRRLDPTRIAYKGTREILPLNVDPALMTQVVFNLLDNAIKYSKKNQPDSFRVEIEASVTTDSFEICFRDYGVGVSEGWEDRVFEPGVRTEDAHAHDLMGEGFGLWFAKEIARRHGGDLVLSSASDPTEFVLALPSSLAERPPGDAITQE